MLKVKGITPSFLIKPAGAGIVKVSHRAVVFIIF